MSVAARLVLIESYLWCSLTIRASARIAVRNSGDSFRQAHTRYALHPIVIRPHVAILVT